MVIVKDAKDLQSLAAASASGQLNKLKRDILTPSTV